MIEDRKTPSSIAVQKYPDRKAVFASFLQVIVKITLSQRPVSLHSIYIEGGWRLIGAMSDLYWESSEGSVLRVCECLLSFPLGYHRGGQAVSDEIDSGAGHIH